MQSSVRQIWQRTKHKICNSFPFTSIVFLGWIFDNRVFVSSITFSMPEQNFHLPEGSEDDCPTTNFQRLMFKSKETKKKNWHTTPYFRTTGWMRRHDILDALICAGCPHLVVKILGYLDSQSLLAASLVSLILERFALVYPPKPSTYQLPFTLKGE